MCDIAIMLGLAFFTACGFSLTMAACIGGESVLPMFSILLAFVALIAACSCDLVAADNDMPSHLMDNDTGRITGSDVGWVICGIVITAAWALPLIIARHRLLDMMHSWLASLGTWCLIITLGLGLVLMNKGQQHREPGWMY